MRLNGWQRIGIVASIVWMVGAAIYQRNADVESAQNFVSYAYKVCADTQAIKHDNDLSSCLLEREEQTAVWMKGSWGNVAFTSLVPIPLGWLAMFILINVGRAANIGFRAVVPWTLLNMPKKVFVVFCALVSFIAVGFGVIVALNFYVDTKVPVTLGYRAMVTTVGNDLVSVTGTWTREGATEGSKMGFPLQTSRIMCYRTEGRCLEARADVSFGNLLTAELVEHEIESWSDTTIVFKDETLCASETYTIDRKTESVNGVGRTINKDNDYCKRYPINEERWSYRLSDGFKVYWEQKQKARPIPLRLIQTLFGN